MTEQEALIEASLQSNSLLGNFEVGAQPTESTSSSSSHVAASSAAAAAPSYPLESPWFKQLVQLKRLHLFGDMDLREEQQHVAGLHMSYVVQETLRTWCKEAKLGAEIHEQASEGRKASKAGRNLSLVVVKLEEPGGGETDISARFVHWQTPGTAGRPVELDHQMRVKALVCVGRLREAFNLQEAFVICPDTGVAMARARGYRYQERPVMDSKMIRLQQMCDLALRLQGGANPNLNLEELDDSGEDDDDCLLCSFRSSEQNVPFPALLGKGVCFQCPVCLQRFGCQFSRVGRSFVAVIIVELEPIKCTVNYEYVAQFCFCFLLSE